MKKSIRMTSLVIIAVAISAISGCSQGPQKKAQDQEHRPGVAEGVAPVFSDGPMAAAYEQYIQLKDALVASDQNKAASSAGRTSAHTSELQSPILIASSVLSLKNK